MSYFRPIPDPLPGEQAFLKEGSAPAFVAFDPTATDAAEAFRRQVQARNARKRASRRAFEAALWIPKAYVALWYVPTEFLRRILSTVVSGHWRNCPSSGACVDLAYPDPNFLLGFGMDLARFVLVFWLATVFVLWRTRLQDKSVFLAGTYLKIGAFGYLAYVGLHFFRSLAGFDFQW